MRATLTSAITEDLATTTRQNVLGHEHHHAERRNGPKKSEKRLDLSVTTPKDDSRCHTTQHVYRQARKAKRIKWDSGTESRGDIKREDDACGHTDTTEEYSAADLERLQLMHFDSIVIRCHGYSNLIRLPYAEKHPLEAGGKPSTSVIKAAEKGI